MQTIPVTQVLDSKFMGVDDLRRSLKRVLANLPKENKVVITHRGKPKAVLVDLSTYLQLTDIQEELSDQKHSLASLEEMKIDVFHDRIFVFTPKGDVIDLPEQSTCVDFAYAVHTAVGNGCAGAKVNEEAVPLNRVLKNGDMVEIMVDKSRKGPNPDWIKFVRTRHAKAEVRQFARSKIASWIKGMFPGGKGS